MTRIAKTRRFLAAAALAVAGTAWHAAPAAAQQARFCDGTLNADSFWTNVISNGSQSRIDYFVQLRNTTREKVFVSRSFNYHQPPAVFTQRLTGSQTLNPYASVQLKLGSQTVHNPSGAGQISTADVIRSFDVICALSR